MSSPAARAAFSALRQYFSSWAGGGGGGGRGEGSLDWSGMTAVLWVERRLGVVGI